MGDVEENLVEIYSNLSEIERLKQQILSLEQKNKEIQRFLADRGIICHGV